VAVRQKSLPSLKLPLATGATSVGVISHRLLRRHESVVAFNGIKFAQTIMKILEIIHKSLVVDIWTDERTNKRTRTHTHIHTQTRARTSR